MLWSVTPRAISRSAVRHWSARSKRATDSVSSSRRSLPGSRGTSRSCGAPREPAVLLVLAEMREGDGEAFAGARKVRCGSGASEEDRHVVEEARSFLLAGKREIVDKRPEVLGERAGDLRVFPFAQLLLEPEPVAVGAGRIGLERRAEMRPRLLEAALHGLSRGRVAEFERRLSPERGGRGGEGPGHGGAERHVRPFVVGAGLARRRWPDGVGARGCRGRSWGNPGLRRRRGGCRRRNGGCRGNRGCPRRRCRGNRRRRRRCWEGVGWRALGSGLADGGGRGARGRRGAGRRGRGAGNGGAGAVSRGSGVGGAAAKTSPRTARRACGRSASGGAVTTGIGVLVGGGAAAGLTETGVGVGVASLATVTRVVRQLQTARRTIMAASALFMMTSRSIYLRVSRGHRVCLRLRRLDRIRSDAGACVPGRSRRSG